jgi:hypothetical protein
MKKTVCLLACLVLVAWLLFGPADPRGPGEAPAAGRGGLAPLTVDRNAPTLGDSLPEEKPARKKAGPRGGGADSAEAPEARGGKSPAADNSACYVCHANYDGETLVKQHVRANVGCVKCHGESEAHRNDEDNITPPDIIYPAQRIEALCLKCHETHDAPAKKVLAAWLKRCPAKENPEELVCTDCHGEHRLKFRTVWWDKNTRQLVSRKGQRVKYAPDYTKKPAPSRAAGKDGKP